MRCGMMPFPFKLIGGFIGLMMAGPIGLAIGVLIGHKLDKKRRRRLIASRYADRPEGVAAAVVVLAAKLAKSDSLVSAEEVQTLRRLLRVPDEEVGRMAALWREARINASGYTPYAEHLARLYRHQPAVLQAVLAVLRDVAAADGVIDASERWILDDIAGIFGVAAPTFPARPLDELLRPASAADIDRAYGTMFDGRVMEQPHLGLKGSDRSLTARLEEAVQQIAARPWARPLLSGGAAAGAAVFVGAYMPVAELFAYSGAILPAAAAAAAGGATFAALPKPRSLADEIAAMARAANVDPDLVAATIQETQAKLAAIERAVAALDPAIRQRVAAICGQAKTIIENLRDDPRDVGRARPFLDHYLTATLDVVQRYAGLQGKPGGGERAGAVHAKLEALLVDIEAIFRKHHESSLADEGLKLEVSIDSLQRMIRSEGA